MNNKNEIYRKKSLLLERLFSLQRFGIKPGLERTLKLSSKVGDPHKKFDAIHVAGTNGKGSVCSVIASVMIENSLKTGLYTSPHLIDFNERIQIDGKMITDEEIVEHIEPLLNHASDLGATFFEITTVLAFKYFADHNVDIAIIETGMGGRFDSTNILEPKLSIITEIGLEHTEYLGDTIEKIALEKAGIIKKGKTVYIAASDLSAREVIINKAIENNSFYKTLDQEDLTDNYQVNHNLEIEFYYMNQVFISPVSGKHQIRNIITAYESIQLLNAKINQETFLRGLQKVISNTNLKARTQVFSKKPLIILDVAHNPQAIRSTVNTIKKSPYGKDQFTVIISVMADKEHAEILYELKKISDEIIVTEAENSRSMPAALLMKDAISIGFNTVIVEKNKEKLFSNLGNTNEKYLICGTFFLIGEFLKWHKENFS